MTRTKVGIRFTISCWGNAHRVETETWSIRYSAVNSLVGWNYRVTSFTGSLQQFQRDIAMLRMIS
ncbi:MAG: hypothetical protein EOP83_19040 [Verrucomicrobiaceae bacterium]|nr:MAG: hypothetical protein EOP83_19040 [Verrucomicrobiaceae bacterium]